MPVSKPIRIALVAGEDSGDQLGAELIRSLQRCAPMLEFAGIGGPQMRAAGCEVWYPHAALAVMGLVEVLRHLPRLLKLRRQLRRRLRQWRPDLFIGIDAPDFNLRLERQLKAAGVKTLHYVSPSIWAWREHRAASIGRSADQVLCLLPMEPAIYARYGVHAQFVGHPLAACFALHPDAAAARAQLGIARDARVLALLPGSRLGEIARLAEPFIDAALRCRTAIPALIIIAPMASADGRRAFAAALARYPQGQHIRLMDGNAQTAMIAADAVLVASGTAALEAMLAKRPMVVGYRIAATSHWLVRTFGLLKSPSVSLPNILAGRVIVPELLQQDCTGERLAAALLPLLTRADIDPELLHCFEHLHQSLSASDPDAAAHAVLATLGRTAANATTAP
ncbi:MAG: lipid-A-disaccharide synthase [Lysobacterales bacterium CG02_land_8_20_14_3_00_62_12]|nr:MAG: lipid-A-disaccharide synthase [Xanthomonadales bacterium CG02_land_8_20_14_3_00_62_12]